MLRNLVMVLFIVPKLIVWPLLWYWRKRRRKTAKPELIFVPDEHNKKES